MNIKVSLLFILLLAIIAGCKHNVGVDPLTDEERNWLNENDGKIIINNEAGWPPIIDIDEDGSPRGISIDYYKLIEQKLNFSFKLDTVDNFINILDKLRNKKIDVICELQKNDERSEYALFTKPYLKIPNVIIVRTKIAGSLTLEQMRNMKIAVSEEYAIHDYLKNNYSYLLLEPFEDDKKCLLATSTKNVDAAVVNLAVASYLIEKEGISNLRVAGIAGPSNDLSFASRKDLPILNRILDKGLSLITESERDDIYQKWVSLGYIPFYQSSNFWITLVIITLIIVLIILVILIWNRSLKRLVEQRTETINKQTQELIDEIERRREAEDKLLKSETQLSTLMSNLPGMAYRCLNNPEWTMLFLSDGCKDLTGYNSDDLMNNKVKSYADIILPEDRELVWDKVQQGISAKAPYKIEYRITKKNGDERWVWEKGMAIINEKNEIEFLEGFIMDITERKAAEQKLEIHHEKLESLVKSRTIELEEKNSELENFNKLFTGREFRIKELKDKIELLEKKIKSKES